jgi:hypothetical protein
VTLYAGFGLLGPRFSFAAELLKGVMRLGRSGIHLGLLFAAFDFFVAQFLGHERNLLIVA